MIKVVISHTSFDRQFVMPAVPRVDEIVSIDFKEFRVWKVEYGIVTTVGTDEHTVVIIVHVI